MRLIAVFMALAVMQGCGSRVELDPRDTEGLEQWEDLCNRRSATVTLNIENRSTFNVRIRIHRSGGGPGWVLLPTVMSRETTSRAVSRMFLDGTGYITLELLSGGLIMRKPGRIWMTPLTCATGTLVIEPDPAMSNYVGADI